MKIEIIQSKLINFFYIIDGLSKWHYSCNNYEPFFKIDKKINKLLLDFKNKMQSYKIYTQDCIVPNPRRLILKYSNKNWQIVKKIFINQKIYDNKFITILDNLFLSLSAQLNIFYNCNKKKLIQIKKFLLDYIDSKPNFVNIFNILNIIFNNDIKKDKLKIYLMISDYKGNSGEAIKGYTYHIILLAVTNYDISNNQHCKRIIKKLLHEIIHLYQGEYFKKLLNNLILDREVRQKLKKIKIYKDMDNYTITLEIITEFVATYIMKYILQYQPIFNKNNIGTYDNIIRYIKFKKSLLNLKKPLDINILKKIILSINN